MPHPVIAFFDRLVNEPQDVTESDINEVQQHVSASLRNVFAATASVWLFLSVPVLLFGAVAYEAKAAAYLAHALREVEGFNAAQPGVFEPSGELLVLATLALVVGGLVQGVVRALSHRRAVAKEIIRNLELLSEAGGNACEEGNKLVNECAVARELRDIVIERGEPLRQFHLQAMRLRAEQESRRVQQARAHEQRAAACRELHGIASAS